MTDSSVLLPFTISNKYGQKNWKIEDLKGFNPDIFESLGPTKPLSRFSLFSHRNSPPLLEVPESGEA